MTQSSKSDRSNRIKKETFWNLKNVRFQIGFLLCLNFFSMALMRNSLGIAMVCMVNSTAIGILEDYEFAEEARKNMNYFNSTPINGSIVRFQATTASAEASICPITSFVRHEYEGEFVWDPKMQGMLFAALYWGSFTSLPGGWLADRYSPRHILLVSVLLNVACSILTPLAATYGGYIAMFIIRLLMGLGQGLQKPTTVAFAARWIPPDERSTAISLYTAGNQISSIVGMPLNAWLCHLRSIIGGWPLIFLSSGVVGLLWCVLWQLLATNRPEHNKRISEREKNYILASLNTQNLKAARKDTARSIPWRKLLLSMPVIACCICSFVNGLVVSTTSSYIPTYFMEVLHLDLYSNGFYSAMPYVSQWVAKFGFASLADYFIKSGKIKPTASTKLFNTIGSFATAAFLFTCSFLTCAHTFWAITLLCLSMASFASYAPGYWTSMVSIAPVYSGTVSALTTFTNQIGSILAPYLVGWITIHGTRSEWQIIFGILSSALIVSGFFYLMFGSADIQDWAREHPPASLSLKEVSVEKPEKEILDDALNHNHVNGFTTDEKKQIALENKNS